MKRNFHCKMLHTLYTGEVMWLLLLIVQGGTKKLQTLVYIFNKYRPIDRVCAVKELRISVSISGVNTDTILQLTFLAQLLI